MLVLGAGPGGYSAAFRAADLGMKTVLVERYATLGGVCLNVGCIPSQGAAARGRGDGRGQALRRPRRQLRRAEGRPGQAAAHKNKVVGKLTGGLAAMAKMRKVTVVQGTASSSTRTTWWSKRPPARAGQDGQDADDPLQARASSPPAREAVKLPFLPKDDPRIVDSTGALELRQLPEAHADRRRRHHRPGDGHGVLDARRAAGRGRDARRPDARRRPRPGEGLAEDERAALRQHHARRPRPSAPRPRRTASWCASKARARRPSRSATTWCCRPWAAVPNGKKIGADKAGVVGRRARLHPGGHPDAHQRAAHLRDRRHRRPADAGAQGGARGARRGRSGRRRRQGALRRARDPERGLHRPRGGLGRPDRRRGQGARASRSRRACSRGPRRAARSPTAATKASPSCCSTTRRTASSAAASSARMPAT